MEDYKKIIKERLDNLPSGLQTFVKSESWRGNVERIGKQFNFTEEQMAGLENEVFLTLLCFSETKNLVENLKKELGIEENVARRITDYMNGAVFSVVMRDIKNVWDAISNTELSQEKVVEAKPVIKDSIGDSFEQAIINQAKAMQPAQIPQNLPIGKNENYHTIPATPNNSSRMDLSDDGIKKFAEHPDPYREIPE